MCKRRSYNSNCMTAESDSRRAWRPCFLPSSCHTQSSFTANAAVNCYKLLRLLFPGSMPTINLIGVEMPDSCGRELPSNLGPVIEYHCELKNTEALHKQYKQCALVFGSSTGLSQQSNAETTRWYRGTENIWWWCLLPTEKDENKDFEKLGVGEEIGLFSSNLDWRRKKKMFLNLFWMTCRLRLGHKKHHKPEFGLLHL